MEPTLEVSGAGIHVVLYEFSPAAGLSVDMSCVNRVCSTTYASRMCSGMLDSTALMSPAPKPVAVRLCLGREKPGPTGPVKVEMGAPVEGLRSRGGGAAAAAILLERGR